jgi:uncharacterized membrane protein
MTEGQQPGRLCVLLACFDGAKKAYEVWPVLGEELRSAGDRGLDEVVLRVSGKGKVRIYDLRRTIAGTLTSALTWGLFGLAASGGSWISFAIWALLGALCGGLYAYYTEHIASKSELTRVGRLLGPNTSALMIWAEAADGRRLLAATAQFEPSAASVAEIADDLSATVFAGAANPVESSSTGAGGGPSRVTVLTMLLLRYPGERAARKGAAKAAQARGGALQVELVFETAKKGRRRVISPTTGVAAMSKSDVVSWGGFGLVFGLLVGIAGNGGVLSAIDNSVVTGVLWAIFGLVAGALYGLWAGRAVSARRLKGVGPLLRPDSSVLLAWADGAVDESVIEKVATSDTERLDLRISPSAHVAVLEA